MSELVPIEKLPPEARKLITVDHPAFKAYVAALEAERKLKPGTLGSATFKGEDPLWLLRAAANNLAPAPIPRAEIPRDPNLKGPPRNQSAYLRDVLDDMGPGQRMLAGAGKSLTDVGRGVGQMLGTVSQAEVDQAAKYDAPLLNDPMGFLGHTGTGALSMALPAFGSTKAAQGVDALAKYGVPGAKTLMGVTGNPYGRAALTGGAYNGLMQPVESGGSRTSQALAGAAAGAVGEGIGQGVNAIVRPAAANASAAVKDLAEKAANKYGIELRASDISKSPVLHGLQTVLDYMPLSGGKAQREKAQKAFNVQLAKTFGESSDDITAALGAGRTRMGDTYDELAKRNTAELDPGKHGQQLLTAWQKFRRLDTSNNKQVSESLDDYLANLVDPANARLNPATGKYEMAGDVYKRFRSEARQEATRHRKNDPTLAQFYDDVKAALDDSMRSSSRITPEDKALYKLTDKQYGNMKTLENLAPKDASGDVDFNKLAGVLTGKSANNIYNRNSFIYGDHDQTLPELARIGTEFLGRGLPPTHLKPWVKKAADAAPYAVAPAVGGSLYSMNMHDEHPILSTVGMLGGLALASKSLGSAANSRWFAQGAAPWIQRAIQGGETLGTSRLPAAGLSTLLRRGAPETFEEGAQE